MQDPIQSSSSIPIPAHQTRLGATDPNVEGSQRSTATVQAKVTDSNRNQSDTSFQDYLNQQQILQLAKRADTAFDPAAEITKDSPYGAGPGGLP